MRTQHRGVTHKKNFLYIEIGTLCVCVYVWKGHVAQVYLATKMTLHTHPPPIDVGQGSGVKP